METPEVGPGDLLLLSLNNIHATQTTDDRRLAVSLRTCDPATPIDWHRVAGSPTPRSMQYLGGFKGGTGPSKLIYPVFRATQENEQSVDRSYLGYQHTFLAAILLGLLLNHLAVECGWPVQPE